MPSGNGDVNGDGSIAVSDAVYVLLYLFRDGTPPAPIPDRPELHDFPFNIVFGILCVADNNTQRLETTEYKSDIATFKAEGEEQKMKYYNILNKRFWAEIVYNTKSKIYTGTKYRDNTSVGMAFGINWDMFFVHFTALGVGSGFDIPD